MKICKKCNIEYETGNFCKKCGSELVEKEEVVCPKCGRTVETDFIFCPACGTKIWMDQKKTTQLSHGQSTTYTKTQSTSSQDMAKKVIKIISDVCGRRAEYVINDQLITCIGGNVHVLCDRLKDEFGITISQSEEKNIYTVGDAVKVVCKHLGTIENRATLDSSDDIETKVIRIIAGICGRSYQDVRPNHVITCISGRVDFICDRLRSEFGIKISEEEERKVFIVEDAVKLVEKSIKNR